MTLSLGGLATQAQAAPFKLNPAQISNINLSKNFIEVRSFSKNKSKHSSNSYSTTYQKDLFKPRNFTTRKAKSTNSSYSKRKHHFKTKGFHSSDAYFGGK